MREASRDPISCANRKAYCACVGAWVACVLAVFLLTSLYPLFVYFTQTKFQLDTDINFDPLLCPADFAAIITAFALHFWLRDRAKLNLILLKCVGLVWSAKPEVEPQSRYILVFGAKNIGPSDWWIQGWQSLWWWPLSLKTSTTVKTSGTSPFQLLTKQEKLWYY